MSMIDWTIFLLVWVGLPAALFGMKFHFDRQWMKKFGERKP